MKQQNFFFYQLTVDLNDMHCIPHIHTGKIIKETVENFVCESDGHHLWISKSIFTNPDFTLEHTPGDDYNMNDEGFDTYMQGYIWDGEKTKVDEEICKDIVNKINAQVKPKIQERVDELMKNMDLLIITESEMKASI
jgi:hypothetical protein